VAVIGGTGRDTGRSSTTNSARKGEDDNLIVGLNDPLDGEARLLPVG
jgi:hypothetical protein